MKRIFTAILCTSLIFCLSACSNDKNQQSDADLSYNSSNSLNQSNTDLNSVKTSYASNNENSNSIVGKYIDLNKLTDKSRNAAGILDGEKVTLEAEGNIALSAGLSVSFKAKLAKDGGKCFQRLSYSSMTSTTIVNNQGTYTLDERKKTAKLTTNEANGSDNTNEHSQNDDPIKEKITSYMVSSLKLDEITYKESGEEKYNGKMLSYEEYAAGDYVIKLYYSNDQPLYITLKKGTRKSEIQIKHLSANADSSLFEVPSDYKIEQ